MWVFWVIGGIVFIGIVKTFSARMSLPPFAQARCTNCKSRVKWIEGQDSEHTGEAKFRCTSCNHEEYRGGQASELIMKTWEEKQ